MTIARRLIVLLAVPLLILAGIGLFTRDQLRRIEDRTRFVAESRVAALAQLGDISRSFVELRVNLRSHLLATDADGRARARLAFDEDKHELSRLLTDYADKRSTSDHGRRLLNDFRTGSQQWIGNAEQAMALADAGHQDEAVALLFGPSISGQGAVVKQVSLEWIKYNQQIAEEAGSAALAAIDSSERSLLAAIVLALAFSGLLGFVTFRSIVTPIRALEASVTTIAAGDYAQVVPFTKATDETGGLARSIDVLKRGAEATEGQRWVKSNISVVTAALQGANSLDEFGERLLSTLVPMLGGGVAGFYIFDEATRELHRIAGYGLPSSGTVPATFAVGAGLVGQCAHERKSIALANLPPEYFRIGSGLGTAAPVQTVASPILSKDALLGVLELAGFRALEGREKTLFDEVLPAIGMNLEILQSNLATQQLLTQTQAQARQLEQQTADLAVAKARAEEATQMKSMFLANMSHEIRTPMNAIIGLSYLALKTPLSAKQRDYVSKVHNAGTSLLAIINDILDFSKIEAGKLDIETTDFQVDEVIGSVVTLTAQKAHEKGLEFLADVSPAIPAHLCGDPLRLAQVLTNLVNNAVKFTERGEVRLKIEQLERQGDKVQLKFSVRDTGIGMTREQAAKLFQPFSQADMSTTRKHGGTGLGLTISRRLVELMGGEIGLESIAGTGSTFAFTVWLEVGHAVQTRVVPGRLQGLRLLVVDDNAAAREILVESLGSLADRADAVSSGAEAIAALRERDADTPYDAVFMDWRMPGMDGLEAARLIKSDASIRRKPAIVMVTAFGREDVREEAEALQLDGFLLKPVTKSMLVDSLVHIFATDEERGTVPSAAPTDTPMVLPGARILLAEDNTINQQIAVELLEGAGATVAVVGNGREAVDALLGIPYPPPYDIVLMDLQMPEMDGYQATAKIRSDNRFASLPIIAMTAHATLEERNRCIDAGMNDHVSKPIHPNVLFDTVSRYYHPAATVPVQARADAAVPVSTPDDGLPVVDGLNTAEGLQRVGGNRRLYLKLLRQFVDEESDAAERIRATLAAGDRATAERMAHTVKGVGGNLGANDVEAAAADVERAVREGTPPVEPLTERLAGALSALRGQTGVKPGSDQGQTGVGAGPERGQTGAGPRDAVVDREAVARMLRCLADFDPAAGECLEADRSTFQALFDPRHPRAIRAPHRRLRIRGRAGPAGRRRARAWHFPERVPHTMNARILIVDDTPANIQMLMAILKERGYQLSAATNGRQAIEAVEKVHPDLVLMDVMMPEMDGYEACRQIKASPRWHDLPIIFLTAKTETADIVRGFDAGAVDYVAKPFNAHELLARVGTHLTMQRLRREMEDRNAQLARELDVAQELLTDARRRVDAALLGESPAIRALRESITRYAADTEPLLLTGPLAGGHEATARGIHHASARSRQAFIHVNCALLPPGDTTVLNPRSVGAAASSAANDITSEGPRRSLLDLSVGGTLYLEEVQRLADEVQEGLATALQSAQAARDRGQVPDPDVRVITYTSAPLSTSSGFNARLLSQIDRRQLRDPVAGRAVGRRARAGDVLHSPACPAHRRGRRHDRRRLAQAAAQVSLAR